MPLYTRQQRSWRPHQPQPPRLAPVAVSTTRCALEPRGLSSRVSTRKSHNSTQKLLFPSAISDLLQLAWWGGRATQMNCCCCCCCG
jgi:hypothetical protein